MKRSFKKSRAVSFMISLMLLAGIMISVQGNTFAADSTFQIKIVHTNDIHAHVAEGSHMLGMPKLKTIIDDWSYGKDRLKELCDMADLLMLCGNVADENGEPFFDEPYYTETAVKGGP